MRRMALVSLLCLAVAGTARGEDGRTPLHEAALVGDVAAIKALLDAGADVDAAASSLTTWRQDGFPLVGPAGLEPATNGS